MISNQFINDCLAGSEEAIQLLIRSYQRQVFQLALSVIDHSDAPIEQAIAQAEIATRETFVYALDKLGSYREDIPFPVWLFRGVVKISRRRYRAWQRERWWGERLGGVWTALRRLLHRSTQDAAASDGTTAADNAQAQKRETDPLWQSVRLLDDTLRIPVVLRYYHDFTLAEIAGILKMSEGTVHARLDKAREKLALLSTTA